MWITRAIKCDFKAQWVVDSDRHSGGEFLVELVQYTQRDGRINDLATIISIQPSHSTIVSK